MYSQQGVKIYERKLFFLHAENAMRDSLIDTVWDIFGPNLLLLSFIDSK